MGICLPGPLPRNRAFQTGGTPTAKDANIDESLGRTAKVGSHAANGFALHDMHGDVTEWCAGRAGPNYYEESEKDDPKGPAEGLQRVVRGGCWGSSAGGCRSARRSWYQPTHRGRGSGFRVALSPTR